MCPSPPTQVCSRRRPPGCGCPASRSSSRAAAHSSIHHPVQQRTSARSHQGLPFLKAVEDRRSRRVFLHSCQRCCTDRKEREGVPGSLPEDAGRWTERGEHLAPPAGSVRRGSWCCESGRRSPRTGYFPTPGSHITPHHLAGSHLRLEAILKANTLHN